MSNLIPLNVDPEIPSLDRCFSPRNQLNIDTISEARRTLLQNTVDRLLRAEGLPESGTETSSKLVMRPHQLNAIKKIADNLAAGNTAGYIKHACATGKTIIAGEFLNKSKLRAIVSVYSHDAIVQFKNEFATHFPDLKVGPYGSSSQVQVITHAKMLSLCRRNAISPEDRDVIVIDESHLMLGPKRRHMVEGLKKDFIIIGLTGTDTYYANKRLSHLLGEPWHTVLIGEAIREKMIAPFKVELVKTQADISKVDITNGDYSPSQLSNAFDLDATIRGGVEIYQDRFIGKSLLVHCGTLRTAALWAEEFNKVGIAAKVLSGELTKDQRREIVEQVEQGKVAVLCGNKLVAASLNIERLEVLYNATPTISLLEAEQRFNRVTRLYPDNPDKIATILEFLPKHESRYRRAILVPDLFGGNVNFGMTSVAYHNSDDDKHNTRMPLKSDALEVTTDSAEIFKYLEERSSTAGFAVDLSKLRITENELREYAKSSFELHEQAKTVLFSLKEALVQLVAVGRVNEHDPDAILMQELLSNTSALETVANASNKGTTITYVASKVGNVLHPKFTGAMNSLHDRFSEFCDKQAFAPLGTVDLSVTANEELDVDELVVIFNHLGSLNESLKRRLVKHCRPLYEEVVEKLLVSKQIPFNIAASRTRNCLDKAIYDLPIRSPHTISRYIAKQLDRLVNDWNEDQVIVRAKNAELSRSFYERRQFEEVRKSSYLLDTLFIEQDHFCYEKHSDERFDKLRRSLVEDVFQDGNFELDVFEEKTYEDFPTNGRYYLDSVYHSINRKLADSIEKACMPRWLISLEKKLEIEEMQAISYLLELNTSDLLRDKKPPWSKETEVYICEKIALLSSKSRMFFEGVFDKRGFQMQKFLKHSTGPDRKDLALFELALSMTHRDYM
jgi:superfamily II DNA or RNA helicase